MDLSVLKFLIVEDDQSFGAALKETLERQKASVVWTTKPQEALTFCQKEKFDFIIIDCLLPGMMGVDVAKEIRKLSHHVNSKIILISGIYTDQNFIQESMKATKAMTFLKKPFDTKELLSLVEKESLKKSLIEARKSLYQTFSKRKFSDREKKKLIESLDTVSGYDLPFIYSLLAQTKSSGHLNIYTLDNTVFSATFSQGCIVGVDMEDTKTYLGAMLIESGYVNPEHVQIALNDKSPRKIGQKLIEAYQLSPHAFELVLMDQMNLRLSRSINDAMLRINFSPSEIELGHPHIDTDKLQSYLHDWIASKVPTQWLKNLYSGWSKGQVVPTELWKSNPDIFQNPILKVLPGLKEALEAQPNLAALTQKPEFPEVALYKGLHFLLTSGLVFLQINEQEIQIDSHADEQEDQRKAEIIIQGNRLIEQAKTALETSQFSRGLGLLQQASGLNIPLFQIHTLLAWAKIGMIDPMRKAQALKDIEIELMQISADEKYDATYSFVMGLYHKAMGDIGQARRSFEKATALDSKFLVAKRELNIIESQNKPQKDILNRDLKDVISGFFKKK